MTTTAETPPSTEVKPKGPKVIHMKKFLTGIEHVVDASKDFADIDSSISKCLMETAQDLFRMAEQIQDSAKYKAWAETRTAEGEASHEYKDKIDDIRAELMGDS